jgi:hypothetical protein
MSATCPCITILGIHLESNAFAPEFTAHAVPLTLSLPGEPQRQSADSYALQPW